MRTNTSFIVIEPSDPAHRAIIERAIMVGDKEALTALKGRLDCTIHYVTSWFPYHLIMGEREMHEIVIIYAPFARQEMNKAFGEDPEEKSKIIPPNETYEKIVLSVQALKANN